MQIKLLIVLFTLHVTKIYSFLKGTRIHHHRPITLRNQLSTFSNPVYKTLLNDSSILSFDGEFNIYFYLLFVSLIHPCFEGASDISRLLNSVSLPPGVSRTTFIPTALQSSDKALIWKWWKSKQEAGTALNNAIVSPQVHYRHDI